MIIGDLADPLEEGPCYQLYAKSFYESTAKPKLMEGGIFVTQVCVGSHDGLTSDKILHDYMNTLTFFLMQAGPAGVFTHTEVFSCIYNTLRHVFRCMHVVMRATQPAIRLHLGVL